uniref:Uncharacterized protein n=1 Tax=Aegilops tauschii subsp. strangulata TaxID=200361 RepID=A0A453BRF8_AEGTS
MRRSGQQQPLGINHRRQGISSKESSTGAHLSRLTSAPLPSTMAAGTSTPAPNLSANIRPPLPHRHPSTRTTATHRQPPGVTGGKVPSTTSTSRKERLV